MHIISNKYFWNESPNRPKQLEGWLPERQGSEMQQETKKLRRRAITAWAQAAHPDHPCPHRAEPGKGVGPPGHLGAPDKVA